MGTSVSLQQTALAVQPGESVSTELRVRNTGDVVDQFSFQPLGDAAPWITVEPPTVRLFPETDALVTVTIAPPRDSSSKPGIATWAVKAVPKEDPVGAAVGEGTVDVGSFVELAAELQPGTGRSRFTGKFETAIDNRGNLAVPVRINGNDTEHALEFDIRPPQVDSQPGSAHFAKINVKPVQRIWRGQPKAHPFQIVVEPQARVTQAPGEGEDAPAPVAAPHAPIVLNGNLLQEPIIPKWLLKALLLLIALLILLFILWKTLLKPQVESAARDAAVEEVAPVSSAVAAIAPDVSEAQTQASVAAGAAEEAAGAAQDAAAAASDAGAAAARRRRRRRRCARQRVQRDHRADQLPSVDRHAGRWGQQPGRPAPSRGESDVRADRPGAPEPQRRPGAYPGADQQRDDPRVGAAELPRPRLPLRRPVRGSGGAVDLDRGRL